MKQLSLVVIREKTIPVPGAEAFTPGVLYANGLRFCFTCEDEDRHLETEGTGAKVNGRTCIPRGRYLVEVAYSPHFGKEFPRLIDVPGYSGVLLHGGNRAEHSLGCILVGKVRTATGIAQCADSVQRLTKMIDTAVDNGEEVWLEVK